MNEVATYKKELEKEINELLNLQVVGELKPKEERRLNLIHKEYERIAGSHKCIHQVHLRLFLRSLKSDSLSVQLRLNDAKEGFPVGITEHRHVYLVHDQGVEECYRHLQLFLRDLNQPRLHLFDGAKLIGIVESVQENDSLEGFISGIPLCFW